MFDVEPLPRDSWIRSAKHVLATPHIGYVTLDLYETFYGDTVRKIAGWIERNETSR